MTARLTYLFSKAYTAEALKAKAAGLRQEAAGYLRTARRYSKTAAQVRYRLG